MRSKTPRSHASPQVRTTPAAAEAAGVVWAMDFMSDSPSDGRRFWSWTVVDAFTREAVATRADLQLTGD
ncbi:hypothetical protein [Paludisphaera soli]|uniref:hypothetical protein n=1 Tax=Paludisphaera soli TaxID=2712865 RepID=UPI0013ED94A1|nr:hypothetical protein [Paludisphaera soli]